MAKNFTLISGSNIYFIPNMNCISKFSLGDFGIADAIKNASLKSILDSSTMSAKETETFMKNVSSDFGNGFKGIEKAMFKSMFDMHIPIVKGLAGFPYFLAKIEDACARALTLDGSSVLKPIYNPNSLNYKLYGNSSQQEAIKKAFNSKSTILKRNRESGIGNIDYSTIPDVTTNKTSGTTWVTISEVYSTGVKIDGIPYNTTYIYKESPKKVAESDQLTVDPNNEIPLSKKPPVVIFGVYDKTGKYINNAIPSFISKNPKYYKNLLPKQVRESLVPKITEWNKAGIKQDYLNGLRLVIKQALIDSKKYTEKNLDLIYSKIEKSITDDVFTKIKLGCFANKQELRLTEANVLTQRQGTFMPMEIEYDGKTTVIDPENDYILQVLKFEVDETDKSMSKIPSNKVFDVAEPYSTYYDDITYTDALSTNQYDDSLIKKYSSNMSKTSTIKTVQVVNYLGDDSFGYSSDDKKKVFYIIEGILNPDSNSEKVTDKKQQTTSASGKKYYRADDFASAVPALIAGLITFFVELLPTLNELLDFLKNPFNAIFETITQKMGEVFDYLDKNILKKYSKLLSLNSVQEKLDYLDRNIDLKKYVSITDKFDFNFVGDGRGTINLFGYLFGFELSKGKMKMILEKSDVEEDNNKSDFKIILNMLALPIKIFVKVIEFIFDIIDSITISNVISKIEYLLSFAWLFDILSIPNLLSFLGIDTDYLELLKMKKSVNKKDNVDKKYKVDKRFRHPMKPKTPDLTGLEFDNIFNLKNDLFTENMLVFFTFFSEAIIKVIDMIFCTFNLEQSKRPIIDLKNLLVITPIVTNTSSKDNKNPNQVLAKEQLYSITFSDGTKINNLTMSQVEEYKITHKSIVFKYDI